MKLHGNASRNDAINGNSPRRRITGTARLSKAAKRLEAADDGFDATDDLDIARVDWRHCAILRLQADAPYLAIEALDRGLAIEHCDHNFAVLGASLGTNEDEIAVENRSLHHRIALDPQHERIGDARHEAGREQKLAFYVLLRSDGHPGGNASQNGHDDRIVPLEG